MTDSKGKLPNPVTALPIKAIKLPAQQPRRYFDPDKLAQLTESVKHNGILENLLVRPLDDNQYELVVGERRYRAAQEAGLTEVPVTIKELTDNEALQISLIENLHREDLNPVEETEGILWLL
ncbi:ParB/RepB/Spo0J family partition protein, partial [Arthrospira platensis SPKY1]|nr:ParB/RepB/Spo0J family partition protein [Arthrospira platensis SPKY1]